MTKSERVKLREGIRLIMAEVDDFHGGMSLLCELAQLDYPIARLLKDPDFKTVTMAEISKGPNRSFEVISRGQE